MADIKTRDTSKGTIKAINKAAVATERMKKAYVMTKDKAEHSTDASDEGNSSDSCRTKTYPVGSSVIYGYSIPAYKKDGCSVE